MLFLITIMIMFMTMMTITLHYQCCKYNNGDDAGQHHECYQTSQCGPVHGALPGTSLHCHRVLCSRLLVRCAKEGEEHASFCSAVGLVTTPQHGPGCCQGHFHALPLLHALTLVPCTGMPCPHFLPFPFCPQSLPTLPSFL